jgi:hypothetical protein
LKRSNAKLTATIKAKDLKQAFVAQMTPEQGYVKVKNVTAFKQKVASEKPKLISRKTKADTSAGNSDKETESIRRMNLGFVLLL